MFPLDVIVQRLTCIYPDNPEGWMNPSQCAFQIIKTFIHLPMFVAGVGKYGVSFVSKQKANGRALNASAKRNKAFHCAAFRNSVTKTLSSSAALLGKCLTQSSNASAARQHSFRNA